MDLLAPIYCPPCQQQRHHLCLGWAEGFCGCTGGLCGVRLITGVMWDVTDSPNGRHEGDTHE